MPSELKTAKTLSCSTSWRVSVHGLGRVVGVVERPCTSILRPLTPPLALTYLKYASAPRATDAYCDAEPVSGAVPPSRIEVGVTPGIAAATRRRGDRRRHAESEHDDEREGVDVNFRCIEAVL